MHRKAEGQEGKECSAALDSMIWLKPKDPPQPSSLAPGGFKHSAKGSGSVGWRRSGVMPRG